MCTHLIPVPRAVFTPVLNWPEPTFEYPKETYVSYRAPIRLIAPDSGAAELREAMFGLVPCAGDDALSILPDFHGVVLHPARLRVNLPVFFLIKG